MKHAGTSVSGGKMATGSRLACLPMYDLPELRADNDALWRGIRDALVERGARDVPRELHRDADPHPAWEDPRLLLAQTCGYPFASALRGRVRLVATPCYDAPGCEGPFYRSWLIARSADERRELGDFRGARLAINAPDSLSGCKVLEMMLPAGETPARFFADVQHSGAHAASIFAVARGDADIAAVDCVTWELLRRHRPSHLHGVRIVGEGPSLPALPLITGAATTDEALAMLRRALDAVVESVPLADTRRRLAVAGFARLEDDDYLAILGRLPTETVAR